MPAANNLNELHAIPVKNCLLENYSSNAKFDVVTMWDLLEHLADPKRSVCKIHELLNPESGGAGLLILEIPVRDSLVHNVAKVLYKLTFSIIKRPLYLTYGIHHLQYFSELTIKQFLEGHRV